MSTLNVMRLLLLISMLYLLAKHWIFFACILGLYMIAELSYRYTVNKRSQRDNAPTEEVPND